MLGASLRVPVASVFVWTLGARCENCKLLMSSLCELSCILRTYEGPRKFVISETGFNILQLISRNPVFCVYVMKIRNY